LAPTFEVKQAKLLLSKIPAELLRDHHRARPESTVSDLLLWLNETGRVLQRGRDTERYPAPANIVSRMKRISVAATDLLDALGYDERVSVDASLAAERILEGSPEEVPDDIVPISDGIQEALALPMEESSFSSFGHVVAVVSEIQRRAEVAARHFGSEVGKKTNSGRVAERALLVATCAEWSRLCDRSPGYRVDDPFWRFCVCVLDLFKIPIAKDEIGRLLKEILDVKNSLQKAP
jgi:hypothetical protein